MKTLCLLKTSLDTLFRKWIFQEKYLITNIRVEKGGRVKTTGSVPYREKVRERLSD